MKIDIHVHISATMPGRGKMSDALRRKPSFLFLRAVFGIAGTNSHNTDRLVADKLRRTLDSATLLDAAVVLAFDAVHRTDGTPDPAKTHLHVTNDYVRDLCRSHPKMLFGCSINPYRNDAIDELHRCVEAGAVLVKWLPMVQGFDPTHPKVIPFFNACRDLKIPILWHLGGEAALPVADEALADTKYLLPALETGVTIIGAHCGSSLARKTDFTDSFIALARKHNNLYGDTAALLLPRRWRAMVRMLDEAPHKLIHGSDWPIISVPIRLRDQHLHAEGNWMQRDVLIKRRMGLGEDYLTRAASILRLPKREPGDKPPHARRPAD